MSVSDGDDWEFKLDEETVKPKREVKASGGDQKDLPHKKKPLKMEVDFDKKPARRNRSALARKEAGVAEFAEIIPIDHTRRLLANIIDLVVVIACISLAWFIAPMIKGYIIEYARQNVLDLPFSPREIVLYCRVSLFFIFFFLFYAYPCLLFNRSLGKNVIRIRIGNHDGKIFSERGFIFIRELIVKPISLFSLVGVLMIFTNPAKRGLHDFICGTALFLDSEK